MDKRPGFFMLMFPFLSSSQPAVSRKSSAVEMHLDSEMMSMVQIKILLELEVEAVAAVAEEAVVVQLGEVA